MPSFEYDARFVQAGLDQMESYLLSNDIYRPVGVSAPHGEAPYPQLTLGAVLLSLLRAQATADSSSQNAQLTRLQNELKAWRSKWRAAWERKAEVEFRSRLNLWRDFLEDYRQHPDANYDRYAYEVTRRVMLELLFTEIDELPVPDSQMFSGLDGILRALFLNGNFIWEPVLKTVFPQEKYWYLYGELPQHIHQPAKKT